MVAEQRGRRYEGASWRSIAGAAVVCFTMLLFANTAGAHDFWLVPDAFEIANGAMLGVHGQTGTTFPLSISALSADRIAEGRIIGAGGSEKLGDFSQAGASLIIRHRPTSSGQRIVAIALVSRTSRQSADAFRRYLTLEGAAELAADYAQRGLLPRDSVLVRSEKFAKTIVEVGHGGPRAFSIPAGHALEILPLEDPLSLQQTAGARFRVTYRGNSLPRIHLHGGPAAGVPDSQATDMSLTTDDSGVVTVPLSKRGLWNLRVAYASPSAPGSGADWDVDFATFVFSIGTTGSHPAIATATDSMTIAETVMRFHEALSTGDSAAAMALLAGDAILMEAGGIESREGYAAEHLREDIAFGKAIVPRRDPLGVVVAGDVAWVSSTYITEGQFNGRPINSAGAELVVLSRAVLHDGQPAEWRIRAIHWSSRRRTQ